MSLFARPKRARGVVVEFYGPTLVDLGLGTFVAMAVCRPRTGWNTHGGQNFGSLDYSIRHSGTRMAVCCGDMGSHQVSTYICVSQRLSLWFFITQPSLLCCVVVLQYV